MIKIAFVLLSVFFHQTDIYTLNILLNDDHQLNLGELRGKKILLVNTASESRYTEQYGRLETLYQRYKDSLVIIVFPSNSFGHERLDNHEIRQSLIEHYDAHYLIASKTDVLGEKKGDLFRWLAMSTENDAMNGRTNDDFYKFLIDATGNIIGAFDSSVDPLGEEITNAIEDRTRAPEN